MARIEWINFDGSKQRGVNLTHSVGKGGRNEWRDVMLIQSLFYYLYISRKAAALHLPKSHFVYFMGLQIFPVTGNMDSLTLQMISDFQAINHRHLLSADGKIEPAKYKNRVIRGNLKTQPLMTITYLHVLAKQVELSGEAKIVRKAAHSGGNSIVGKVGGTIIGSSIALLAAGVDYVDQLKKIAPEMYLS